MINILIFSIWSRAIDKWFPEFDLTQWGWKEENDLLTPHWTTLPEASKACKELVKCSCKTKCGSRCQCKKIRTVMHRAL